MRRGRSRSSRTSTRGRIRSGIGTSSRPQRLSRSSERLNSSHGLWLIRRNHAQRKKVEPPRRQDAKDLPPRTVILDLCVRACLRRIFPWRLGVLAVQFSEQERRAYLGSAPI